jgi:hypothetical protein
LIFFIAFIAISDYFLYFPPPQPSASSMQASPVLSYIDGSCKKKELNEEM